MHAVVLIVVLLIILAIVVVLSTRIKQTHVVLVVICTPTAFLIEGVMIVRVLLLLMAVVILCGNERRLVREFNHLASSRFLRHLAIVFRDSSVSQGRKRHSGRRHLWLLVDQGVHKGLVVEIVLLFFLGIATGTCY
jgi:hypothetical protein